MVCSDPCIAPMALEYDMAVGQNPVRLVNIKIGCKWSHRLCPMAILQGPGWHFKNEALLAISSRPDAVGHATALLPAPPKDTTLGALTACCMLQVPWLQLKLRKTNQSNRSPNPDAHWNPYKEPARGTKGKKGRKQHPQGRPCWQTRLCPFWASFKQEAK